MNKPVLLLSVSFFLLSYSYAQQYTWVDLTGNLPDPGVFGGLGKVFFIGEDGWITQSWYTLPREIYYTHDGGQTFISQPLPDDAGTVGDICVRSNYEGYIVTFWDETGNTGKIFHSDDARTGNWSLLAEVSGSGFFSISFPPLPYSTGYLGGAGGEIWKINGDTVFYDDWCHTNYDIFDLDFPVDDEEGWAVGGMSIEHRTSAGWQNDQNFTSNGNSSVDFMDNETGWVCGDEGLILITEDGHNWFHQHGGGSLPGLSSIHFCDMQNGWAVGNGLIYHTVDGGGQWDSEPASISPETWLKSVYVVNSHTAYAVGESENLGPVFLKYMQISEINEPKNAGFTLCPNPVTNFFRLKPGEISDICQVEILDLSGRVILTESNQNLEPEYYLRLDGLASGIYIVRISAGSFRYEAKLIKE